MTVYGPDRARFMSMGDRAFTVELADSIGPDAGRAVAGLDAALGQASAAGRLPGLTGTTQTFRSLTVHYDPLETGRSELESVIRELLAASHVVASQAPARWALPVSYEGSDAPDLEDVARACGLTADAVVEMHSGTEFVVYMLGFLPGFPFMGDVPAGLHLPRRAEPRVRVPAGSVAITGQLTAVYPWESPGGWNLIGRCPVPLFNADWAVPALLAPNDRVRFVPRSAAEVAEVATALAAGALAPETFRENAP